MRMKIETIRARIVRGPALLLALAAVTGALVAVLLLLPGGSPEARAASPAALASADYYIKLGDIKGEATDEGHKDWIEILSFSNGVTRPSTGVSATRAVRSRGSAILEDFVITKRIDKATPKLMEAVLKGNAFPLAELHVTGVAADGTKQTYFRYELKNVLVTNYRIGGAGDAIPIESISLNFEQIKIVYTEQDESGNLGGDVQASWDVVKNAPAP